MSYVGEIISQLHAGAAQAEEIQQLAMAARSRANELIEQARNLLEDSQHAEMAAVHAALNDSWQGAHGAVETLARASEHLRQRAATL